MDLTGYDALTLEANEREWLQDLRRLSERDKVEYGIAAHGAWVSEPFTDRQPNSVHIPPEILSLEAFSLYHAHTNETLLSAQDLRLLLNPNVEKVAVITPQSKIAVAFVGYGYRPDMLEFNEAAYQIQMDVGMEIFDNPSFETMSVQERNTFAINEKAYRLARRFEWNMEGGEFYVSESVS